jgi:2-(1,2-epoxy-1,2-dihydrophenyl)acetyl-CoA isomerase
MSDTVITTEHNDDVAIISLRRPDAMNAFDTQLRADLLAALERTADNDSIRIVVLTGEGRSFSAGADLNDLTPDTNIEQQLQAEYRPILERIGSMRQPVIAAVNGPAAGIGLSCVLACDLVIMADTAFLLSPFTTIALVPDGGLSWFLVQQLGYRRAFQLSIESERIGATRCVELGLANKVAPADALMADTLRWATALSERAPLSVSATKAAMRFAAGSDWGRTFDLEAAAQRTLYASADHREGVAAFFEKRKPRFLGK